MITSSICSYTEAESILCSNKTFRTVRDLDDISKEFGELSGYVMQLLSKICKQTERMPLANDCCRASLKHNPFLWNSFVDLCNRGERPNVKDTFKITNDDLLSQLEKQLWSNPSPELQVASAAHPHEPQVHASAVITPNNNPVMLQEKFDTMDDTTNTTSTTTPLMQNSMNTSILPTAPQIHHIDDTPYRKQFKYLQSNLSPVTPSFGVLPLNSSLDSIKQTSLFLTPSPPMAPQQQQQQPNNNQQQFLDSDKNSANKKIRGSLSTIVTRREISTPLQQSKPIVLTQSSNITPNRNQIQQQQDQYQPSVRRSTRIFSNYSVKENNKSPNLNKFVQPRSPPKKTSKRLMKSSKSSVNELNEKNNMLTEKSETITSNQFLDETNFVQSIATLKRQSADGLLQLLQVSFYDVSVDSFFCALFSFSHSFSFLFLSASSSLFRNWVKLTSTSNTTSSTKPWRCCKRKFHLITSQAVGCNR